MAQVFNSKTGEYEHTTPKKVVEYEKFLKKESISTKIFTIVTFNPGGDYVKALYIDNKLYKYGDPYHDQISTYFEAFIDGIKYTGTKIDVEKMKCTDDEMNEDITEMASTPPKNLDDVKGLAKYK